MLKVKVRVVVWQQGECVIFERTENHHSLVGWYMFSGADWKDFDMVGHYISEVPDSMYQLSELA